MSQPDDFKSNANHIDVNFRSLLKENNEARLRQKDRHEESRTGGGNMGNEMFDPSQFAQHVMDHQIRHRYRENYLTEGMATHLKSKDDIV